MNWSAIDWSALERLRAAFLAGTAGDADYWRSDSDLASYDATFAQRIGWKWDYVLAELQCRRWSPAPGALLDWGCGSGIAHRDFLHYFGTNGITQLHLWDKSPLAMRFAERRAKEKHPGLKVTAGTLPAVMPDVPPGGKTGTRPELMEFLNTAPDRRVPLSSSGGTPDTTILISHVLTELQPAQIEALADFAATATSVIWVEPGTFEASQALITVRERLRGKLNVIAPCTHGAGCGLLAPGNARHWCHHFAAPPPGVFTDGNWSRFANLTGVDLRDLPLSFLVLDRRPPPALPPAATRVIGHPRIYKPHALLLACEATGVTEKRLTKRAHPEIYRELKRGHGDSLQVWACTGDEIVKTQPLLPPPKPEPADL